MGEYIEVIVETHKNGEWQEVSDKLFLDQNYNVFAFLVGFRNYSWIAQGIVGSICRKPVDFSPLRLQSAGVVSCRLFADGQDLREKTLNDAAVFWRAPGCKGRAHAYITIMNFRHLLEKLKLSL